MRRAFPKKIFTNPLDCFGYAFSVCVQMRQNQDTLLPSYILKIDYDFTFFFQSTQTPIRLTINCIEKWAAH